METFIIYVHVKFNIFLYFSTYSFYMSNKLHILYNTMMCNILQTDKKLKQNLIQTNKFLILINGMDVHPSTVGNNNSFLFGAILEITSYDTSLLLLINATDKSPYICEVNNAHYWSRLTIDSCTYMQSHVANADVQGMG